MTKIDLKDRKIISALDMNARMPLTELAKKVGLSRQVVEYRIKRMKEEGVILGAKAVFDSAAVNYKWYRTAFRMLNVKKEDKLSFIDLFDERIIRLRDGRISIKQTKKDKLQNKIISS